MNGQGYSLFSIQLSLSTLSHHKQGALLAKQGRCGRREELFMISNDDTNDGNDGYAGSINKSHQLNHITTFSVTSLIIGSARVH